MGGLGQRQAKTWLPSILSLKTPYISGRAPGNYSLFPFGAGFGVWGSIALGIRQSISRLFVGFVEFCKEHFLKISEGGQPIQFWKPNGLATKISTRTKARSLNLTWFGSFCLLAISFYLLASQCLPLGQWAG